LLHAVADAVAVAVASAREAAVMSPWQACATAAATALAAASLASVSVADEEVATDVTEER
jgi:phosphate/sulfate permease